MQDLELLNKLYSRCYIDEDGCWIWTGAEGDRGYGIAYDGYKSEGAHRLSYKHYYDTDLPKGCSVLHKCNKKLCINPIHLYLGDQAQNVKDAKRDGLFKPHPSRKLTSNEADLVRYLYSTEEYSTYKLSELFNVNRCVIRNIVERGLYKNND